MDATGVNPTSVANIIDLQPTNVPAPAAAVQQLLFNAWYCVSGIRGGLGLRSQRLGEATHVGIHVAPYRAAAGTPSPHPSTTSLPVSFFFLRLFIILAFGF